jgi:hypothetical protein
MEETVVKHKYKVGDEVWICVRPLCKEGITGALVIKDITYSFKDKKLFYGFGFPFPPKREEDIYPDESAALEALNTQDKEEG